LLECPHIPGDVCRLYGISDVHLGAPDCDEDLFRHDLEVIAKDEQARVVINGDILNYNIRKSKGDIYHEKYPPSIQKRLMREWLEPIKDKILVMVGGNHDEGRTDEDATPVQDIAEWLGVPYQSGEACLCIRVGRKRNGKPAAYIVYLTHGWTSSRFIGGKALNLDRLKDIVLADVYMIAHTHSQHAHADTYFVPDPQNKRVTLMTRHFVNLGSYQKRGGYPIRRGLPAQVLGTPLVKLSGTEKHVIVEL
jgi:predicted phosphodiesterase